MKAPEIDYGRFSGGGRQNSNTTHGNTHMSNTEHLNDRIEMLKAFNLRSGDRINKLIDEIHLLKGRIERLEHENKQLKDTVIQIASLSAPMLPHAPQETMKKPEINYGLFSGDGRETVGLEICGINIKKSAAKRIINRFLGIGEIYSDSGVTAEVCMMYCTDVGLDYTWESNDQYPARSMVILKKRGGCKNAY